ncbi:MAG: OmpA family protein [Saprospiraceae bacterium]|nr:OmpA family protein [Saprospiraceae bacterium]
MRFQNIISTIFFLFILITSSLAQNVEFDKKNFPDDKDGLKEAKKELKQGDEYYEVGPGMYPFALEHYLSVYRFNPNNALLNYKIGKCFMYSTEKTRAIPYFLEAQNLNPNIQPDLNYLLAQAYHLNYEFDEAIERFKTYKQSLGPIDLQEKGLIIEKKIKECETGKDLVANPVRVFIDNIGPVINSTYADYSPIINADESVIMFTSRRDNTTGFGKDPSDGNYFEDIYISHKLDNGSWAAPENPGKPLNSDNHDAIVGLSADGNRLFLYKGDKGGDIYECYLKGDKWSKPNKLDKTINSSYHESSASFSYDLRTIYFVSNREGGYGEHDIYVSNLNSKGNWEEAVNLGAEINTPYNEEGIFMHPDGKTFYFSSKGHNTMGGFDIFKTVFEDGKWSEPKNIGYPINTTGDDVFFTVSANGKRGYYSSAKKGGLGNHDIYIVNFLGPEKPIINSCNDNLIAIVTEPISEIVIEPVVEIETSQLTLLKGTITDEFSGEPLFAQIELTDNETGKILANFESNSKTGKYLVSLPSGKNYGIAVKAEGCLFHSENINVEAATTSYQEIIKDIKLKRIEIGSKVVLKNIFFDTGKSTLRKESTSELERLQKLMEDVPTLKIEISGHTDNVGSETMNQGLSEKRAKAVVDYLIGKGIDQARLTYKGFGFAQPIATNDTEEGRQQNRRTEFKIVGN